MTVLILGLRNASVMSPVRFRQDRLARWC